MCLQMTTGQPDDKPHCHASVHDSAKRTCCHKVQTKPLNENHVTAYANVVTREETDAVHTGMMPEQGPVVAHTGMIT